MAANVVAELAAVFSIVTDSKSIKGVEDALGKVRATALGFLAVTAGRKMWSWIDEAATSATHLVSMSAAMGMTIQKTREWGYIAEQSGSSLRELSTGMNMFLRNVNEVAHGRGGKALHELFAKAGIGAKEQAKILSGSDGLNEVLLETSRRIQQVGHASTTQQALFTKMFGVRAGRAMLADLARGPEAIAKMQSRFRELAGVMSDEDALKLRGLKNRLHDVGVSFDAIKMRAVLAFGPTLLSLVERLTSFLTSHGEQIKNVLVGVFTAIAFAANIVAKALGVVISVLGWFEDHPYIAAAAIGFLAVMLRAQLEAAIRGVIVQVMRLALFEMPALIIAIWETATLIGSTLVTALAWMGAILFAVVIPAITAAIAATWAWTAALLTNPIFLIITAIAVAALLIYKYWGPISAFFKKIGTDIWHALKFAWDKVASAAKWLWDHLKSGFHAAWDFISHLPVIEQMIWLAKTLARFGHIDMGKVLKSSLMAGAGIAQGHANAMASSHVTNSSTTHGGSTATTDARQIHQSIKIEINESKDANETGNKVNDALQRSLRHAASSTGWLGS